MVCMRNACTNEVCKEKAKMWLIAVGVGRAIFCWSSPSGLWSPGVHEWLSLLQQCIAHAECLAARRSWLLWPLASFSKPNLRGYHMASGYLSTEETDKRRYIYVHIVTNIMQVHISLGWAMYNQCATDYCKQKPRVGIYVSRKRYKWRRQPSVWTLTAAVFSLHPKA